MGVELDELDTREELEDLTLEEELVLSTLDFDELLVVTTDEDEAPPMIP